MLAHSRTAVNEFRMRLAQLIGDLVHEVEIKTFHAYALQILGITIDEDTKFNDLIIDATSVVKQDIELPLKTMLVLDEFQDVSQSTFAFIEALLYHLQKVRYSDVKV